MKKEKLLFSLILALVMIPIALSLDQSDPRVSLYVSCDGYFEDNSSYGNTATLYTGTYGSNTALNDKFGSSCKFDGTPSAQKGKFSNSLAFNHSDDSLQSTFTCMLMWHKWVNADDDTAYAVWKGNNSAGVWSSFASDFGGGSTANYLRGSGHPQILFADPVDGQWDHYAFCFQKFYNGSGTTEIYINGTVVVSQYHTGTSQPFDGRQSSGYNSDFQLAHTDPNFVTRGWGGELDEIIVIKGNITTEELADLINNSLPEAPPSPPAFSPEINITAPANNTYFNNPLITSANISYILNFNATNCTLYDNGTGIMSQHSSVSVGDYNITTYYNITKNVTDLIGYYRMESTFGNIAYDSSIYKYNGVSKYNTLRTSKGGNATLNYCYQLNGTSSHINISDKDIYSFGNGTNDLPFSITAWAYFTDAGGGDMILSKRGVKKEYDMQLTGAGFARFHVNLWDDSTGGKISKRYDTPLGNNEWMHLTMTYNGNRSASGIKLYLNRIRVDNLDVSSGSYTAMENTIEPVLIGSYGLSGSEYDGRLDEVQIWKKELNQSEITSIYNYGSKNKTTTTYANVTTVYQSLNDTTEYNFDYPFIYPFNNILYYISCYDDYSANSSFYTFTYKSDFTAPTINVITPLFNESFNIDIDLNFTTSEISNCTTNMTEMINLGDNGTYFNFEETSLGNDDWTILIACEDQFNNIGYLNWSFTKDQLLPEMTFYTPKDDNSSVFDLNESVSLNIKCEDDNMFAYEALIYDDLGIQRYNFTMENLDTTIATISDSFTPDRIGNWSIIVTCSDSHTSNNLKDFKPKYTDKGIEYNPEEIRNYKKKVYNISIEDYSDYKLKDKSTEKIKKDRYNFKFKYDFKGNHEDTVTLKYKVECKNLMPVYNSDYFGHFICMDSKTWIDFENPYILRDSLQVYECPSKYKDCYIVEFDTLKTMSGEYVFNSIGGLNYNIQTRDFIIEDIPEPVSPFLVTGVCPDSSTTSVLMFGLIFAVLLAFWMIGEFIVKYPIFNVLVEVAFLFFGFALIGCSTYIGGILIGLSIMLIIWEFLR